MSAKGRSVGNTYWSDSCAVTSAAHAQTTVTISDTDRFIIYLSPPAVFPEAGNYGLPQERSEIKEEITAAGSATMEQHRSLVLLLMLATALSACKTVYYRATDELPPSTDERVVLRIEQATTAARSLRDALGDLERAEASSNKAIVLERADAAAWELDRRVASIRDVADRLDEPDDFAAAVVDAYQDVITSVESNLAVFDDAGGGFAQSELDDAIVDLEEAIALSESLSSGD